MPEPRQPPAPWRRTLHGHLTLARISNSPTVVSDVAAGAVVAGARVLDGTVALVAVAMILFYTAGMYLNDLCDYAVDCRERPERPLPSGLVSLPAAAATTVALFALGAATLWPAGAPAFAAGLILIALIVLYDRWHKAYPLSPLVMAACRLLVYVVAALAVWPAGAPAALIPGTLLALYVAGLTYVARSERSLSAANLGLVSLLFLPILYVVARPTGPALSPLLLLFVGWTAYNLSFVYRPRRQVGRAVGQLIAGISLVDGLILAAAGSGSGVALALAAFSLTLLLQRRVKGT